MSEEIYDDVSSMADTEVVEMLEKFIGSRGLEKLMEPYRDSDIDSGGKRGLTSRDGLEVEDIVIKIWGLKVPERPKLPKDYRGWTEQQRQANEEHREKLHELFNHITDEAGWC